MLCLSKSRRCRILLKYLEGRPFADVHLIDGLVRDEDILLVTEGAEARCLVHRELLLRLVQGVLERELLAQSDGFAGRLDFIDGHTTKLGGAGFHVHRYEVTRT